jgi:hypothetical protein
MPMSLRRPQVGTLRSTIADGLHMTIRCDAIGCHNRKTVDLEALSRELARIIARRLRGAAQELPRRT